MICPNCGKTLSSNQVICPNCNNSSKLVNFYNNKMGENGKRAEYITEKYNMKKGIYEGKNVSTNNTMFLGIIVIFTIVLIIVGIAIANYLL